MLRDRPVELHSALYQLRVPERSLHYPSLACAAERPLTEPAAPPAVMRMGWTNTSARLHRSDAQSGKNPQASAHSENHA